MLAWSFWLGDHHHSLGLPRKLRGRRMPPKFRPVDATRSGMRLRRGRAPDGGGTPVQVGFTASAPALLRAMAPQHRVAVVGEGKPR